jgi:hypothetical protein
VPTVEVTATVPMETATIAPTAIPTEGTPEVTVTP